MSRKHYRAVAEVIEQELPMRSTDPGYEKLYAVADALSVAFKQDNPNFKRAVFMDACGFPNFR